MDTVNNSTFTEMQNRIDVHIDNAINIPNSINENKNQTSTKIKTIQNIKLHILKLTRYYNIYCKNTLENNKERRRLITSSTVELELLGELNLTLSLLY